MGIRLVLHQAFDGMMVVKNNTASAMESGDFFMNNEEGIYETFNTVLTQYQCLTTRPTMVS